MFSCGSRAKTSVTSVAKVIPVRTPLPRRVPKKPAPAPIGHQITDAEEIESYLIGVRECIVKLLPPTKAVIAVVIAIDRALAA